MEEISKKIADLEKQRDEYLDGWKRAKADFINYKKDEEKRFLEFAKLSNEKLLEDLLSILDSFELGMTALKEDEAAKKGMSVIKLQLEDVLRKYGVQKIIVTPGMKFEASSHEAIEAVESDKPPGTVLEEVRCGYTVYGNVLRPVKVKVSK